MTNDTGVAGNTPTPTNGQGLVVPANHAHLNGDLGQELWRDVPALTWIVDPVDLTCQVRSAHALGAALPVSVRFDAVSAAVQRCVQRYGFGLVRELEKLSAMDGSLRDVLILGFVVDGRGVQPSCLAGVALDITRPKSTLDELAHQALVDELTGLYNRRGFYLLAEHELRVARRRGTRSAVLYVDVDGLKAINDTHGHARGSAALVETAALLRSAFRECDLIARLGGDEFAVFAADIQGEPDLLLARLRRALGQRNGDTPVLSLSAGVGSCPADPGLQLAELLAAADRAMYRDKVERLAPGRGNGSGGT